VGWLGGADWGRERLIVVRRSRLRWTLTAGLLSRGSQVRVLPGALGESRRLCEIACKRRISEPASIGMNGDMVRRSAPPRALEVASWSHRGPRLAIGRSVLEGRISPSARGSVLDEHVRDNGVFTSATPAANNRPTKIRDERRRAGRPSWSQGRSPAWSREPVHLSGGPGRAGLVGREDVHLAGRILAEAENEVT
jgi:hypothetical protein